MGQSAQAQNQNPHDASGPAQANGIHRQTSPQNGMQNGPVGILSSGSSNPLMMYLHQQQQHQTPPQHPVDHANASQSLTSAQAQAAFYSAPSSTPQPLP